MIRLFVVCVFLFLIKRKKGYNENFKLTEIFFLKIQKRYVINSNVKY